MLYGNVGARHRIDFTVSGQAVNIAARIEGLCGKLGEVLLFSEAFAGQVAESSRNVGEEALKGQPGTFKILTVA